MKEETVSVQDYIAILQRRKWSLILPVILIFSAAVVVAMIIPKVYRSTSTILIEEQEIPREFVAPTVTGYADQRLQMINQRVMVTSKLMEIVKRFNLYQDKRKSSTIEELVDKMRKDILFKTISADVTDRRSGNPAEATIAFSLSYQGKNPEVVQKVTDALTSLYLEENLKQREHQSSEAYKFLDDEANNLKNQLNKIDTAIADLKKKNVDALPELLAVNLQSLDTINRELDRLNDSLRALRERKSFYQNQIAAMPTEAETQDKTLLRQLKTKLAQLESQYSNKYPEVIKTRAEISKLENKILTTEKSTVSSIFQQPDNPAYITMSSQLAGAQSEIDSVRRQIDDLNRKKEDYRRRLESSPKVDETYKRLLTERNNLQLKYNDLMGKALEAKISHGLEKDHLGERFNLIEPARLPEKPIKPKIAIILLLGIVLGIGAGIGTAAYREAIDQSVRSAKLLAQETALPVLASIPDIITWGDIKRRRNRKLFFAFVALVAIILGITAFHFYVMDLDIVWAKILRRLNA